MHPDTLFWNIVDKRHPLPNAARLLGWTFIKFDKDHCEAHIEFDATDQLTNPLGNIQGGMLTAMLDDAMGPAVYANLPANQLAMTTELNTHYIHPALPGRIIATGRVDHRQGDNCITSGVLMDKDGKVLTTATAIYRIVNFRS
ncbi:PaaI family thioesterase [Pseudomonas sp. R5(2019)]|uniref:PaaI family thioesterase n=1 Tax=Pseudomonas sp. R5(2019) TaxID=2697566 RepID=UPI00141224FB|nr:PaaI family thioesterase [Pseudomonas sp. R5(2019)]NBA97173.1 hotdog fold thioesterase [Pseudomonas sp. R5(2019)]